MPDDKAKREIVLDRRGEVEKENETVRVERETADDQLAVHLNQPEFAQLLSWSQMKGNSSWPTVIWSSIG